jgi:hypothetical protein
MLPVKSGKVMAEPDTLSFALSTTVTASFEALKTRVNFLLGETTISPG